MSLNSSLAARLVQGPLPSKCQEAHRRYPMSTALAPLPVAEPGLFLAPGCLPWVHRICTQQWTDDTKRDAITSGLREEVPLLCGEASVYILRPST
jgi:hypothetical protein